MRAKKAMKEKGFTNKLLKENLRQHQFFKKGIGSAVKEIFDIPKDEPKEDEEGQPFPPGNAYGGPYSPGHAFTATKRFQVLSVGGRHSEHAQFVDEFDTVDEVINSINLPEEYGTEWAEEIKDVSNWSSEGFEDGLRRFGIGEVYEVIDIGSYEDNEEIDIGAMVTWNQDGPMKGEVVDVDVEQGFAVVETGFGIPAEKYVVELGELTKAIRRKPRSTITRFPAEDNEKKQKGVDGKACWKGYRREGTKMKGGKRVDNCVKVEDNEEPKRGITGYQHTDALAQAAFAKKDKVDIDEIDLNRWREYPAEDVMKAVYRRYGKELPSVDSYDWAISWDKKIRPWLKEHEGNL
jgi:hypothetical protein